MANEIELQAEPRPITTKGAVQSLRRSGRVPAVTYGDQEPPLAISVDAKALQAALHGERGRNTLIQLKVGESSHAVLVKEIQRHPLTRVIHHVDFHRVSLKRKIETLVPVHTQGEAPGVKLGGGVLEHIVRDLRVRCLPTEIPAALNVDVSNLQLNQSIKVKDLAAPSGVEILMDPDAVVVNIVTVAVVEEAPAAAEAAPAAGTAEPEVIKKGKTEEGEAETAAAPEKKPEAKK